MDSYQLLAEKPDEIAAQNVSIHKSDHSKGNHFEGAADVGGDVISASEVHKHYYYGMPGTTQTENSEFRNNPEEKRALQSLLRSYQRNHRRLLEKRAVYALGEEPLYLLNQIEDEERKIAEIEQKLLAIQS